MKQSWSKSLKLHTIKSESLNKHWLSVGIIQTNHGVNSRPFILEFLDVLDIPSTWQAPKCSSVRPVYLAQYHNLHRWNNDAQYGPSIRMCQEEWQQLRYVNKWMIVRKAAVTLWPSAQSCVGRGWTTEPDQIYSHDNRSSKAVLTVAIVIERLSWRTMVMINGSRICFYSLLGSLHLNAEKTVNGFIGGWFWYNLLLIVRLNGNTRGGGKGGGRDDGAVGVIWNIRK